MTPTQLEQRLSTALAARAEQVTAADLRPPAPPTGVRRPNHRWLFATVAMAAAMVGFAVVVVIGQVRESPVRPSHQPQPTVSASAETRPEPASATPGPSTGAEGSVPLTPSDEQRRETPTPAEPKSSPTVAGELPDGATEAPAIKPAATGTPVPPQQTPSVVPAKTATVRPVPR